MNVTQTVLVTGAAGMIGSATVQGLLQAGHTVIGIDRREARQTADGYYHYVIDLADKAALDALFSQHTIDRVIHLAALAHSVDGKAFTWEDYYRLNVVCAKNVFEAAGQTPVLFISTVDVFGFTDGPVTPQSPTHPVSHYAKSKVMAEGFCAKLPCYTIFRFSPVYTDTVKRDIQKRYYLKYPNIAYRIGTGTEYEVLNIQNAVKAMVSWCAEYPKNEIRIIKDPVRMNTARILEKERQAGRAKYILVFPVWLVNAGYQTLKFLTGKNKYTYLLNKAVFPLRTEQLYEF